MIFRRKRGFALRFDHDNSRVTRNSEEQHQPNLDSEKIAGPLSKNCTTIPATEYIWYFGASLSGQVASIRRSL
jgi:hypothetical protein